MRITIEGFKGPRDQGFKGSDPPPPAPPARGGEIQGRMLESLVRDLVMLAGGLWALRHRVRRSAA